MSFASNTLFANRTSQFRSPQKSTETGKAIEILARAQTTAEKTSELVVGSKFRDHNSVTIGWRNHLRATRVREPAARSIVCRCTAELAPPTSPFYLQMQRTAISILLKARHLPAEVWCGAGAQAYKQAPRLFLFCGGHGQSWTTTTMSMVTSWEFPSFVRQHMKIKLVTELVCKPHGNKHSGHMKIKLVKELVCKPRRNKHSGPPEIPNKHRGCVYFGTGHCFYLE